ncbi:hypothetical protein DEU56DRAFT_915680 [Suillus clintonianus]|uniref:uncharacterized protein n=1 Tax=Suillus clintonianus TaxID=1904413 RepID=UPI001B8601ED|nr:uncharacterized protein DEU56DRAFT_915680 [Suillus clintonianus]KAG2127706.1 hypothetical protein DEU56DRAFT_915680 [Suillus clintonianus]
MTLTEPGVYWIVSPGTVAPNYIEPDGNNPERYCVLTEKLENYFMLGTPLVGRECLGLARDLPQRWLIKEADTTSYILYQRDDDSGAGIELAWSVQLEETGKPIYISYKGQTRAQCWGFVRAP